MTLQLPPHGIRFYDEVVARSMDLIQVGIWEGIRPARLRTWLNNFTTEIERYFCACLLDSLIYRSEDQTVALTAQVFLRALPDISRQFACPLGQIGDWLALFCELTAPLARIVPVLKPSDPPGKSGDIIARLLKRGFRIHPDSVIEPKGVFAAYQKGIRTFIFMDDFLGTGQQFQEVLQESKIDSLLSAIYAVYAPLAAHVDGIGFLGTHYPDVHVCPGEILDWSHSLFHSECNTFADGVNDGNRAKSFYYKLLEDRGIVLAPGIPAPAPVLVSAVGAPALGSSVGVGSSSPPFPNPGTMHPALRRGFGYLELAYAFHHSIPDNCLPAFWWSKSANWNPLFNR